MFNEERHWNPDREFRDRLGAEEISLRKFKKSYKLSLSKVGYLYEKIGPALRKHDTNHTVQVDVRLLTCLEIMASGTNQRNSGRIHGPCTSSVCKMFSEFLDAMIDNMDLFIKVRTVNVLFFCPVACKLMEKKMHTLFREFTVDYLLLTFTVPSG